jgi:hypothetical protein
MPQEQEPTESVTFLAQTRVFERGCSCEESVSAQNATVETTTRMPISDVTLRPLSKRESRHIILLVNATCLYPLSGIIVSYLSEIDIASIPQKYTKIWVRDNDNQNRYEEKYGRMTILDASLYNRPLEGDVSEVVHSDLDIESEYESEDKSEDRGALSAIPPRIGNLDLDTRRFLKSLRVHVVNVRAIREYNGGDGGEDYKDEVETQIKNTKINCKDAPFTFKTPQWLKRKAKGGKQKKRRYEREMLRFACHDERVFSQD